MELKKGYKNTELGVFPEDWEIKKLGEICEFQNGTALETYFNKKYGYKVISIGNYSENGSFKETNNFISKNNYEFIKKFILNKMDLAILMNDKTSVGTIIGRVLYIDVDDKYIFNQRTMRLSFDNKYINSKFIFHLINSDYYHSFFVKLARPGTQIYLNTDDVLNFKINIPKTREEQTTIATILSDMDALISSLEKLIAKKRSIKQGAMQKLLQPKDGWEIKKLGEIGYFKTSSVDKIIINGEKIVYLVNYMNVYRREKITNDLIKNLNITSAKVNEINNFNLKKGDILFTPSSETPDDIGHSIVIYEDLINTLFSYHLIRFRPTILLDINFSHYFCNTRNVLNQMSNKCTGSTRYTLSKTSFSDVKVQFPKNHEEQTAIATILTDMDAEIAALETKLDKYRKIKLGMMQNLLTGRIRLI